MQEKLQMVEFSVSGLEEVRTLLKRWKKVLAGLAREDEAPYQVWRTHRPVGIEVEDRRPGGGGALDLPGPQGGAGALPGRPQAGGAGGL